MLTYELNCSADDTVQHKDSPVKSWEADGHMMASTVAILGQSPEAAHFKGLVYGSARIPASVHWDLMNSLPPGSESYI